MKHTFKERLEAGMTALGWQKEVAKDMVRIPAWVSLKGNKYWVGPNGGLRRGKCRSQSMSVGDATHQTDLYKALLAKGDAALAAQSGVKEYV